MAHVAFSSAMTGQSRVDGLAAMDLTNVTTAAAAAAWDTPLYSDCYSRTV